MGCNGRTRQTPFFAGLKTQPHCKNYSVRLPEVSTPTENDRVVEPDETEKPVVTERVLIVEDDPATRVGLAELVGAWGFQTDVAANGEEAMDKVTTFRPAIIVSDLVMPRMGGLDLLRALKDQLSDLTIILLTAQGTVDSAVEAIKEGAYDYLSKPVDPSRLRILLQKAVERQETLREVKHLRRQLRDQGSFGRIIGNSPSIRAIYRVIEQAAPTSASVLIWGESGTGKELAAQTIHELSPRASFPFVAINCAAIPETLLESEIFGHEKGAFTGAHDRRTGVFELAHRGTLFLDEIAEMQPATQVKLLRVLQERSFRRLGGRQEQSVDVRVIAATNQNPTDAVKAGRLREDLYYRLNVFAIEIPPLRDRREDVPLLIQRFLNEFNATNEKAVRGVDQDAMQILEQYPWPGNIRELRNVIERATILTDTEFIGTRNLPPLLVTRGEETLPNITLTAGTTVDEAERKLILLTLDHMHNNKTRAAEVLGISLKTLHNKLNRMKEERDGD
jgi:DNA-binding NtrC family response regulator